MKELPLLSHVCTLQQLKVEYATTSNWSTNSITYYTEKPGDVTLTYFFEGSNPKIYWKVITFVWILVSSESGFQTFVEELESL